MRIHFFNVSGVNGVFFPDSLRYFETNPFTDDILRDIVFEKQDSVSICKKYDITEDEQTPFYTMLNSPVTAEIGAVMNSSRILNRLVLHIANTCNFACRYCYAGGGNYLAEERLMPSAITHQALMHFFSHFEKINTIQLFGGEPFLNPDAIRQVCQFVETIKTEKRPQISVVTNGSVLSEELLSIISRYNISVTVSLDGPAALNDHLRFYRNGANATHTVEENIITITERTGKPVMIEGTYTSLHEEQGIYFHDLVEYYHNEFKSTNIHIVPVMQPEGELAISDCSHITASIGKLFENSAKGFPLPTIITKVVTGLKKKKISPLFCDAGVGTLAVSSEGNVYPCFMLNNNAHFLIGNVNDPYLFESGAYISYVDKLSKFSRLTAMPCRDCFANTLCSGCIGQNYFETGDIHKSPLMKCELEKSVIEHVIAELIKCGRANPAPLP